MPFTQMGSQSLLEMPSDRLKCFAAIAKMKVTNPSAYGHVGVDNLDVSAVHGPDDFIYGVMSAFSWPKSIGRFAKVGFEDRFDDEFYRHLNHSVANGRNPQGSLTAFAFGYHDPLDRRWFIRLDFECFFQLRQISGFPFFGFDGGKGNAVYPGTASNQKRTGKLSQRRFRSLPSMSCRELF